MKATYPKLPHKILVKVKKGKSGKYLIELPELDVFTEAETLPEIAIQVNDLIYSYFDIPLKYQKHIQYSPSIKEQAKVVKDRIIPNSFNLNALFSPTAFKAFA